MRSYDKNSLLLWLAALSAAVAVCILLVVNAVYLNAAGAKRIGIVLDNPQEVVAGDEAGQYMAVLDVESELPADKGGIQAGDYLLAMAGTPIHDLRDYDRVIEDLQPGASLTFTLLRNERRISAQVEPGADFPWLSFLSVLTPALAYLALGLLCLMHWRTDVRARLLAVLVLAIAVELALPMLTIAQRTLLTYSTATFYLVTGVQFAVEFHLVSLIPARAPWLLRWPRLIWLSYILGLGGGVGAALLTLSGVMPLVLPAFRDLDPTGIIISVWALAVSVLLTYQMVHYPSPRGRQQAGLVLVGLLPWVVMTELQTLIALQHGVLPRWWFSAVNWALMAFPIAVFVAIFRYRLFDLELLVRRSLVFSVVSVFLIGILYMVLAAAWPLASATLGSAAAPWIITGAAVLLGILASRIRTRVERAIEFRVFPERHALRRHLIRLAASLPLHGKLTNMANHLADELCLAFRVRSSSIVVVDPVSQLPCSLAAARTDREMADAVAAVFRDDPRLEKLLMGRGRPLVVSRLIKQPHLITRLHDLNVHAIAPLILHNTFIGAICLGEKHTEKVFPGEELELLNLLSHHVATAFENARLAQHATYEQLTGLYRREFILDILDRECLRAVQHSEPIAVAMIDIDHFKETNDDHGHPAGDLVLQQVAKTILQQLRSTDLVGRYGGDEFLVVLPNTSLEGAGEAAEHVREGIEHLAVTLDNGETVRVSASIGLAAIDKAGGKPEELARTILATADRYLYEAKHSGRNHVIAKLQGDSAA